MILRKISYSLFFMYHISAIRWYYYKKWKRLIGNQSASQADFSLRPVLVIGSCGE